MTLPAHGDRGSCASCGQELVVTGIVTYPDGRPPRASCEHAGSGQHQCQPELWDAVADRHDYDRQGGTLARWKEQ